MKVQAIQLARLLCVVALVAALFYNARAATPLRTGEAAPHDGVLFTKVETRRALVCADELQSATADLVDQYKLCDSAKTVLDSQLVNCREGLTACEAIARDASRFAPPEVPWYKRPGFMVPATALVTATLTVLVVEVWAPWR